jgi:thiol-disulfide isomerase/thioredoxin
MANDAQTIIFSFKLSSIFNCTTSVSFVTSATLCFDINMTKMKMIFTRNIIRLILLFLILTACHSQPRISGSLDGANTKDIKVYLIAPQTLWEVSASYFGKVIDSAVVNNDGSFEFCKIPKFDEAVLLEVVLQQPGNPATYLKNDNPSRSNYMPVLWQNGEAIRITAIADEFQKTFSMEEPSEINKALFLLRDVRLKSYESYLAGRYWDQEEGSQLLEKQDAILQYQKDLIRFADSTSSFIPAMLALRWVSPEMFYEPVAEFLVRQCYKWAIEKPDHPWVRQLCKESDPANLPVLVGDEFPDIELPTLTKDTLFLNDQLGDKLTIIDLWASWCAPCRIENREALGPVWDEYHDEGLQIIAYGLESDESVWRAAAESDGADRWLQSSDLQGDNASILEITRVQTIPANFILDARGVVLAKNLHGRALLEFVETYMNKPCLPSSNTQLLPSHPTSSFNHPVNTCSTENIFLPLKNK